MENNIIQKHMAKRLGISTSQMSKIEMAHHEPKGEIALRILEVLIPSLKNEIQLLEINHELKEMVEK